MNKKLFYLIVAVWMSAIIASFTINLINIKSSNNNLALSSARSFFLQIVLTREWNARHGGVYVPVTEITRPNIYLKNTARDIKVNRNLNLTMINPAYMTRQLSELAEKEAGIKFHITSLMPIRPANEAKEWEKKALEKFNSKNDEFYKFDGTAFRYMAPLITEKPCLNCHRSQGYVEGDIRGGISITINNIHKTSIIPLLTGHLFTGITGLILLMLFYIRLKNVYDELYMKSHIDSMTGLLNRRYLEVNLNKEFGRCRREKQPISIIMCDIDFFKKYNDTYGHVAGDNCLKKTAETITSSLYRAADIAVRYGGEEFIIILPNTNLSGALHVGETIRKNIEMLEIEHKKSSVSKWLTCSMGVSTHPSEAPLKENQDLAQIDSADAALYKAKQNGRNRLFYQTGNEFKEYDSPVKPLDRS